MKNLNEFLNESDSTYEGAMSILKQIKDIGKYVKDLQNQALGLADQYEKIQTNMVQNELEKVKSIIDSSDFGKSGRVNTKTGEISLNLNVSTRTYDMKVFKQYIEQELGTMGAINIIPGKANAHMETKKATVVLTKQHIKNLTSLPSITTHIKFAK